MGKLNAQIRESYFNPIMQIFPVLTFIVINYFRGRETGWLSAVGMAVALAIYVGTAYKGLFRWYMFHMLIFFIIVSAMSISSYLFRNTIAGNIIDKIVLLLSLAGLYAFKRPIVRTSDKLVSPLIPMSNNITEFYNIVKIFIILSSLYTATYFTFFFIGRTQVSPYFKMVNFVSVVFILLLIIYYFLKTKFVRMQLSKERWLPIITKNGKIIGTIQRLTSLSDRRKYMHPVVRGLLVKDGRVLLQRSAEVNDLFYKPSWDSFIDNHINIGEKAEDCLTKTAFENFGIEDVKSFYLTKYTEETEYEYQYALVFIVCNYSGEIVPNPGKIAQMKWWTIPQIEANLTSGIFDERFVKEYDLLKRSGLLNTEDCGCE